jgi:DNA-binding CsgD family transcriptional regulator
MQDYNSIISGIYDCAANPELWPQTLENIRGVIDCAYVMAAFGDFSSAGPDGFPIQKVRSSPWDQDWFQRLEPYLTTIPHVDKLYRSGVDIPWIQMEQISESDVQKTKFYQEWVRPQKLRDCMNTLFMDRQLLRGVVSFATPEGRPLLGDRERKFSAFISPHIRRAMAINDLVDKGNLALALYRKVLDTLSVAVFVMGPGGKMIFTNARGEAILADRNLLQLTQGKLGVPRSDVTGTALDDAITRGIKGDGSQGISGIGVPLVSLSGERAAAYVLPFGGNDLRGQIGPGHAAVFIARRGEQLPMATEILRTVFDLTPTEAKVAYATSLGDNPEAIAISLGNATDTVRAHLKSIYHKVDVADKTALAARVNALIPPIQQQTDGLQPN